MSREPALFVACEPIEYWFTGPDVDACRAAGVTLGNYGIEMLGEPFDSAIFVAGAKPILPWSFVGRGPATLDPTLVSATAIEAGCRYHPEGGYGRWVPDPHSGA